MAATCNNTVTKEMNTNCDKVYARNIIRTVTIKGGKAYLGSECLGLIVGGSIVGGKLVVERTLPHGETQTTTLLLNTKNSI